MAFIKAFAGALGSSFANQWLEYMTPPSSMRDTTLIARAVASNTSDKTQNTKGNSNIITNGSKIMVPEGTCLVTVENGAVTAVIAEPGGYEFVSEGTPESRSIFAGDGIFSSTFGQAAAQFKFGGQPGAQQFAFYINIKPINGLRYGTSAPIYFKDKNFDDTLLEFESHGTYTIKVVDPLLLIKNFIPADIISGQGRVQLDLGGEESTEGVEAGLFGNIIDALSTAATVISAQGQEITSVRQNRMAFVDAMRQELDGVKNWSTRFGLTLADINIQYIDYTKNSYALVEKRRAQHLENAAEAERINMLDADKFAKIKMAEGMAEGISNAGKAGGMNMMGLAMNVNAMGQATGMNTQIAGQPQVNPVVAPVINPAAGQAGIAQNAAPVNPENPENPIAPQGN
ncbi:SPFH domain-containing protein [Candidatus Saccharibacteria bacterium]|nr:SPFH domain-containing protein [Candidatus Saccharibacteria bacterium]